MRGKNLFSFSAKGIAICSLGMLCFAACENDKSIQPSGNYPSDIANIVLTKCATTGCHTTSSKLAAGGLDMSTWNHLFEGGNGGSVVIPFRSDQSWLMYFTNTDSSQGPVLKPTMPYNAPPLSSAELETLKTWIDEGAPNSSGEIPFGNDPLRKKFYVANQGCDLVSVFDADSKLVMRDISIGNSPAIEAPHEIEVSPDGQYWYVVFYAGTTVQKFRTSDDSFVGEIDVGGGGWSTIAISPDGTKAFVVDFTGGKISYIDLENLTVIRSYLGFQSPHGIDASSDFNTLYVTSEYGNVIYKIDITDPMSPSVNDLCIEPGSSMNFVAGGPDPHQINFSPDGSMYFITCQGQAQVRAFKTSNDSLLAIFPVGSIPQEMSVSEKHPYLFVTCMEDECGDKCDGSVYVINYQTLNIVTSISGGFYQPHDLAVDDEHDVVYVPNRNINPNGPAPHHSSTCGGRNGFVRIIDISTLQMLPNYKAEISVDPYAVAVRR
ncbi:MAG: hypothetical protein ACHQD9_01315 [Chitinophagales bacterium]